MTKDLIYLLMNDTSIWYDKQKKRKMSVTVNQSRQSSNYFYFWTGGSLSMG